MKEEYVSFYGGKWQLDTRSPTRLEAAKLAIVHHHSGSISAPTARLINADGRAIVVEATRRMTWTDDKTRLLATQLTKGEYS